MSLALGLPLFFTLGVARLLVLALPRSLAPSPALVAHAFFQLFMAALLVVAAAFWQHRKDGLWRVANHTFLALSVGVVVAALAGRAITRVMTAAAERLSSLVHASHPLELADPQGALALLPAYQIGLMLALWIAAFTRPDWRRVGLSCLLLGLTQLALLLVLGELASHIGIEPHARDLRAWAVALPPLIILLLNRRALVPRVEQAA